MEESERRFSDGGMMVDWKFEGRGKNGLWVLDLSERRSGWKMVALFLWDIWG